MGIDRTFEAMPIREVVGINVTSSYVILGLALTEPVYILSLFNSTDGVVYISEDAISDHYRLPPGTTRIIDLQANKVDQRMGAKKTGMQFYVRGIAGELPTEGIVWIEGQTL